MDISLGVEEGVSTVEASFEAFLKVGPPGAHFSFSSLFLFSLLLLISSLLSVAPLLFPCSFSSSPVFSTLSFNRGRRSHARAGGNIGRAQQSVVRAVWLQAAGPERFVRVTGPLSGDGVGALEREGRG